MKLNKLPLNVIGLNRVGLNQIGSPSHRANTSDRPYIDPEVLASLVAVCICDGKSNNDPDRAVIKNLVDPDNPFVISNAAYKLNSGYGKYEEDFTDTTRWEVVSGVNKKPYELQVTTAWNPKIDWIALIKGSSDLKSVSLNVSGIPNEGTLFFYYGTDSIQLYNGNNKVTLSGAIPQTTSGYRIIKGRDLDWSNLVITQIPSHQGAFVTDGKDDLIASTKTVKEMLGGSNEVTVVSMVHQIGLSSLTTINNIRSESVAHLVCRNICSSAGKTGIYGYSRQINTNNPPALINNILGDKKDYTAEGNSALDPTDKFFVQGYKYSGSISEVSQIAYYWTFVSNKVLTTDQINQVISYFNLDKHVKPDVYYDVKKQGLSNDTPEADWYLKDFSGNGHDMTLYNFAKKLDSGVGKYEVDFNTWIPQSYVADSTYTSNKLHITNIKGGNAILYTKKGANAMKVKITGIQSFNLVYRYIAENDVWEALEVDRDGIYELPASTTTTKTYYTGFTVPYYTGDCDITIEQIPDYEGALVSDGIDDYGKVENLPIYKDYTVVADREMLGATDGGVFLKGEDFREGAFSFDYTNESSSFGGSVQKLVDTKRLISYQSKYVNNGININAGTATDTDKLWLAKLGNSNRYSKLALWSFLLFPYSLSEFLLERQLKRYKLGTLYPDMVEWRPIYTSNVNDYTVTKTTYFGEAGQLDLALGRHYSIGTRIRIYVKPNGAADEVTSIKVNGVELTYDYVDSNYSYAFNGTLSDKSPQKINITIDEYIRYEDIVQPYPAIINLKQDGKTITWGDKLKVGSDIVFVESANLLPELYTVSETRYNGVTLYPNTIIKVEKSMVFDNARIYLKANEPNCILSPNRLRIPNSSYKILGYIPDISGHGNHGVIHNSAYAGMSGANGYIEPFNDNKWHISSSANKINRTDNKITVISLKANRGIIYVGAGTYINEIKVIATGIPVGGELIFHQDTDITIPNNVIVTIGGKISTGSWEFIVNDLTLDWSNLVIEQLGQYEGSFCLDGVDDFITIPTLASGAKQVLMKVNWSKINTMLYDQRGLNNLNEFGIFASDTDSNNNETKAYYSRNNGSTYIDGVLNTFISSSLLKDITHNIICTNKLDKRENIGIHTIGRSSLNSELFGSIRLYSFMSFSEISSEEEIQELNDIVGIENNIEVS